MKSNRPLIALTFLVALAYSGCAEKNKLTNETDSDKPQSFQLSDLHGKWVGDFDTTWTLSGHLFLKDTLRGESAYPKDVKERTKIVKKEIEPIISNMAYTFNSTKAFHGSVQGTKIEGNYSATQENDNAFKVLVKIPGRDSIDSKRKSPDRQLKMEIKMVSKDSVQITLDGTTIAFIRSKP